MNNNNYQNLLNTLFQEIKNRLQIDIQSVLTDLAKLKRTRVTDKQKLCICLTLLNQQVMQRNYIYVYGKLPTEECINNLDTNQKNGLKKNQVSKNFFNLKIYFNQLFSTQEIDTKNLVTFCQDKYSIKKPIDEAIFHSVLDPKTNYVYRPAQDEDLAKIVEIAKSAYPCEINGIEKKRSWFNKNDQCFYVVYYKNNEENIVANINILPINEKVFRLLENTVFSFKEKEIKDEDIQDIKSKNEVKYLYIEGLAVYNRKTGKHTVQDPELVYLLLKIMKKMIISLANEKNEVIICALGGSDQGEQLLNNFGFQIISNKKDRSNKDNLNFYSIAIKPFLDKLEKHIDTFWSNRKNNIDQLFV